MAGAPWSRRDRRSHRLRLDRPGIVLSGYVQQTCPRAECGGATVRSAEYPRRHDDELVHLVGMKAGAASLGEFGIGDIRKRATERLLRDVSGVIGDRLR